ncbi:hypothetical protein [Alkaliphilus sp. B6464]|uniref:hypothetical protein n=1 Tax=Alkaliphilus sp. B6464 TaxID=2731219 RepID=UPI001BA69A3D|nr:hypothetical protein [Alkaliphilus sp. B6464]QUH21758.1 hypothetical protein HYG84_17635 [Alkaliphilus sp. B6464]
MIIFNEEDVVYNMPIRFWEEKEPIKCIVKKRQETSEINVKESSQDSIYVYSEEFGHGVYVNRKSLFFSKENCRKAIELYSKLHDLYSKDESDKIVESVLSNGSL